MPYIKLTVVLQAEYKSAGCGLIATLYFVLGLC